MKKKKRLQVRWRKFLRNFTFNGLSNVKIDISEEEIYETLFLHAD